MNRIVIFLFSGLLVCLIPSCKLVYPGLMLQQRDYQYFELAQQQIEQYIVQPGDQLTVKVYTRDGFKLIDVIGSPSGNAGESNSSYLVDNEGFVRLPVLGDFFVSGYSESELERILAEKLVGLFVDPYIIVNVVNRRAIIFKGTSAKVVPLNKSPTTLFEVIASSGGLDMSSKAYKIKLIRGDLRNPEIHLVDLSTLESIRKTDLIVQGNDIIYIEPKRNYPRDVLSTFTPYIGLISTVSTLIILGKTLGK